MLQFGSPICVDQYNFSPKEVLGQVSIEQYIEFVIYSLEYRLGLHHCYLPYKIFIRGLYVCMYVYRSIILEQLSEQKERQIFAKLSQEVTSTDGESPDLVPSTASTSMPPPYGMLLNTCVIRDLGMYACMYVSN